MDKERVVRRVHPTASYTLTVSNIEWLKDEAKRRGMRGPSELLRELIDEISGSKGPEVVATNTDLKAA